MQGYSGRLGVKVNTERTKNLLVALQNTLVQMAAFVISFPSGLAKNIFEMILSLGTKSVVGELVDMELQQPVSST